MTVPRPTLTPRAAARLADFEAPRILGASRQLEIAADLLISVAEEHDGDSAVLAQRLREVVAYLSALRGVSSQAFPNALALMLDGLDDRERRSPETLQGWVIAKVRGYDEDARGWMATTVAYGAALASGSRRLLAYDYSSTVAAILRAMGQGANPPRVVLPEARTLDGGKRYVEELADANLRFEIIPDAAIGATIRGCDLALFGAETIAAGGGCYNTTGSFLVALACQYWRVPLYTPSTLVKIDTRTLYGYRRPEPDLDQTHLGRLQEGWPDLPPERLTFMSPDLDFVPPELITAYVTEAGVLPPAAIASHAARLAHSRGNR